MNFQTHLDRLLNPIRARLWNIVRRAVVLAVADGDKKIQVVTLRVGLEGENLSTVERVQNFGFTSHPLEGAQAVVLSIGGEHSLPLAIAIDDANYRVVVDKGEVAIYNAFKSVIKLCKDGTIELGDGTPLQAALDGVVTKQCVCAFTGGPHPMASTFIKAKKGP